jgi:hypothetical protein
MSLILLPGISHAYFQSKGEERGFLKAGYKVNCNINENTFVLYDDFISNSAEKNQILFPKSKFFIPVDLISVAFPLPIVFHNHTTTENAIADLLYANLKLKQLMEEYEKIQASSKKIIENVKTSSSNSKDFKYFSQHKDNKYSIYNMNRSVQESSVKIGEINRKFANVSPRTLSAKQPNGFKPSFTLQTGEKGSFRPSGYKPSGAGNTTHSSIDNGENLSSGAANNQTATEKVKPDRRRQNVEISDFANTVNRVILYLIKNKGEAVFYIIGLYFILLFFSAIFRR